MKNFNFAKKIATAAMFAAMAGTLFVGGMSTIKAAQVRYQVPCVHPVHPGGDIIYDAWGNAVGVAPCGHGTRHPFDWAY